MTSSIPYASGGSVGIAAVLSGLLGAVIVGYGLLLVPVSALGGGWIAVIGLALILSGAVATEAVGNRLGLPPGRRHGLSLAFAGVAAVLLIAFVAVNGATFESDELESAAAAIRG